MTTPLANTVVCLRGQGLLGLDDSAVYPRPEEIEHIFEKKLNVQQEIEPKLEPRIHGKKQKTKENGYKQQIRWIKLFLVFWGFENRSRSRSRSLPRACLASTAAVYSRLKLRWVMAVSSITIPKSLALFCSASRMFFDTAWPEKKKNKECMRPASLNPLGTSATIVAVAYKGNCIHKPVFELQRKESYLRHDRYTIYLGAYLLLGACCSSTIDSIKSYQPL